MITIRKAVNKDIGDLVKIETECFSMPWSEKSFSDALCMENTLFLTAEHSTGEIAGYCGLYQSLDEAEITNVAVAVKFRRQQIAGRLIQTMLQEASKRGIEKIFLEVRVSNMPAIKLYQKYGFTMCGRRRGFYEKPKEDAWLMVWEEKRC